MLTPQQFGAKGDGSDDSVALQKWLDEAPKDTLGGRGTFCHKAHLTLRDGTDLQAYGLTLKNIGDWGIVQNDAGARIRIQGVRFEGVTDTKLPVNAEFVTLTGTRGSLLRDCYFGHRRGNLLVPVENVGLRIESCEFEDWGILSHTGGGVGQYVGGCAIFCQRWNNRLWITDPYVHNGAGGIWLPVTDNSTNPQPESCILSGFQIFDTLEFGIVGAPTGSAIGPGLIRGVKRVDVSGHGMEMHGRDYSVSNVTIMDCDATGAYFSNTQNVHIGPLITHNIDRLKEGNAAVVMASFPEWANVGKEPPNCCTIEGICGVGGIRLSNQGGGAMKDILCKSGMNNVGPITKGNP